LDISPIWIPIVSKGIINSKRRSPSWIISAPLYTAHYLQAFD
jgi:hypothetical protein